jgi:hypothetical protein
MYVNTEIMFPPSVIPTLRDACGPEWRRLVDSVSQLEETHPESLAFSLMMIRLNGCLECETDSYRAMRGCAACALQSVRRFRNNERELIRQYKAALKDMQAFLNGTPARPRPKLVLER